MFRSSIRRVVHQPLARVRVWCRSISIVTPSCSAVKERVATWDELFAEHTRPVDSATYGRIRIAGGQEMEVDLHSWKPIDLLDVLGRQADSQDPVVVARVDGQLWDLQRLLPQHERVQEVRLVRFSEPEGKEVFWHSASHLLGWALEHQFGDSVRLCDGPALRDGDGGFFYECWLSNDRRLGPDDLVPLQQTMRKAIKSNRHFQRMEVSRDEAARFFPENPFKLEMLSRIPVEETVTMYRCGPFIDLCRGPHVPSTTLFRAVSLFRTAGARHPVSAAWTTQQWDALLGPDATTRDASGHLLQRVYGIAFPEKQLLDQWKERRELAQKRDHRVISRKQHLVWFHDASPGSAFLLPHGTRLFNTLAALIRHACRLRGYEEVMTPLLLRPHLWQTSGHWENYRENMFLASPAVNPDDPSAGDPETTAGAEEKHMFALKPMNCPAHCLLYQQRHPSKRDLPLRILDLSPLHRNEATGALGGLTRLRRFHQDDAHIFCTRAQIADEVAGCLSLVKDLYTLFGFTYRLRLSTRPEKYVGTEEQWNEAETSLAETLRRLDLEYEVEEGDGAFYGPKIDVTIQDALGRDHQCATIQLDFQLPQRFDLWYDAGDDGKERPVIIHRAILGSLERMMAILMEHTGGKWPFWLSPRQVMVCPVADRHAEAANALHRRLFSLGVHAEVDHSARTIPKKVREAQVLGCNVTIVLGDNEVGQGLVTARFRDDATESDFQRAAESLGLEAQGTSERAQVTWTEDRLVESCTWLAQEPYRSMSGAS